MKKSGTMKKMLTYYKPYMRVFWTDMFFATLSAAVALIIPLVVRYVTYNLVYREPAEILHQAAYIAIGLFALVAVDCYSKFYICNYGHVMGAKIEYDMRAEIFAHYQKLSFSFYDDQKVGQLMSRITTDLFDISELMHHGPENIILSVIKIAGALIILVNINPMLAVAAFAILPFMLIYAFVLNKKMRLAFKQNRVKIADINAQIEDNLSGIRVVKSFANEEIENRKFKQGNDGFLAAKKNSYFYMGSYQAGLGAFTTLIQVSVILTGTVLIAKGSVDVSDLVTFMLYISVFTDPVRTLIDFTEQFQNGYTGFERFQEILAIHPDIEDKKDAVELKDVKGDITFENVSFQYEENTEKVLNHISLNVPAGAYMALVGSSGAGKSTLLRMAAGILKQDKGNVRIDDMEVYDNAAAKEKVFYISDECYFPANFTSGDIAAFYQVHYPKFEIQRFSKLMRQFQLDEKQKVSSFSKGMKKQLMMLLGISAGTKYLLCDETFDGLDPVVRQGVKSLLAAEIMGREFTPVLASHSLRELEDICDHVGLLYKGGILLSRELEDMKFHIHRIQCVLKDQKQEQELKRELDILKMEHQGSLILITARGTRTEIMTHIRGKNPLFCEVLPLSLEEIFISETEVAGYEIQNIFF